MNKLLYRLIFIIGIAAHIVVSSLAESAAVQRLTLRLAYYHRTLLFTFIKHIQYVWPLRPVRCPKSGS